MIEYFNPYNIDDRIVKKAVRILSEGGIIAYPTDTSWGIGCSVIRNPESKSSKAQGRILNIIFDYDLFYDISGERCGASQQFEFKFIKQYIPGPYVFVLPALIKIEKKIRDETKRSGYTKFRIRSS